MITSRRAPLLVVLALLSGAWLLASPPTPVLAVSPTSFSLSSAVGASLPSQSVSISNAGTGALKWTAGPANVGWLKISPTKGTNTGTLTLSIAPFSAIGTFTAQFLVRSGTQSTLVTVMVAVTSAPAPPPPPPPPPPTPPPPTGSLYGPQTSITCPAGAVSLSPGASIQTAVNNAASGTTFCLHAGTYAITSAITPKSGDTFVGEYGAILDGSGWSTTDTTQGAFRAHNQDIDDVTIRNLVITHMPQKGIHAYYFQSDRWTVEYCDLTTNQIGLNAPSGSTIAHNFIRNNAGGGYQAFRAVGTVFDTNDISANGNESKVVQTQGTIFRTNYVHDSAHNGIWYDTSNTSGLIEGNLVEDNAGQGIFYEISSTGTIRNNTVRRSGDTGIFISTSQGMQIYDNVLEGNFRGIQYFLNCPAIAQGYDLANNSAHGNTIVVPSTSGAWAGGFSYNSGCTVSVTPYLDGTKALTFQSNAYTVPSSTGSFWIWGFGQLKTWTQWQAIPQDALSTRTVQ